MWADTGSELAGGGVLSLLLELGLRHDEGDGETGTGVELGTGPSFRDEATGPSLEDRGRTLPTHGGDVEEWGVNGLARLDSGARGRGLSLSVRPAWGEATSGVERLWEDGMRLGTADDSGSSRGSGGGVEAELGHGVPAPGGRGVLTPCTDLSVSAGSQRLPCGRAHGGRVVTEHRSGGRASRGERRGGRTRHRAAGPDAVSERAIFAKAPDPRSHDAFARPIQPFGHPSAGTSRTHSGLAEAASAPRRHLADTGSMTTHPGRSRPRR